MIPWETVARFAWQAMQPPDPRSPVERFKRAHAAYVEAGDACELFSEVCKLSEPEERNERC